MRLEKNVHNVRSPSSLKPIARIVPEIMPVDEIFINAIQCIEKINDIRREMPTKEPISLSTAMAGTKTASIYFTTNWNRCGRFCIISPETNRNKKRV